MIERTPNYDTKLSQSLKDRDLIDVGDKVIVITSASNFDGIVKYKACNTGDCWIFEELSIDDRPNGNIRYVQNFIEIIKYKKNEEKDVPF